MLPNRGRSPTPSTLCACCAIGLAIATSLALTPPVAVAAQARAAQTGRVHGIVTGSHDGKGIEGVQVAILGTELRVESDGRGRFVFPAVPSGTYRIIVERMGFTRREGTISIPEGQAIDVTIELAQRAVELDPIEVTVRSGRLVEAGFYDRRDNGGFSGHFISRLDLERHAAVEITDALADVPGVKLMYLGIGNITVRFNRHVSTEPGRFQDNQYALDRARDPLVLRGCEPDLYVDGRLFVNSSPPIVSGKSTSDFGKALSRVDDFNVVPVNAVDGIEVYVGAAVPPFVRNTACGVILLWTKR